VGSADRAGRVPRHPERSTGREGLRGEHARRAALHLPGQTLAGTAAELDDGWFRLLTWRDAAGATGVWAWVSTYDRGRRSEVDRFREQAQAALERLFS
jgi:hypothetical protein